MEYCFPNVWLLIAWELLTVLIGIGIGIVIGARLCGGDPQE